LSDCVSSAVEFPVGAVRAHLSSCQSREEVLWCSNSNNQMKHLKTSLLLTAALLSLATASAFAQATKTSPAAGASASASASPSTPPTIASAIDREVTIVEKEVVETAEAMPEDKFDFSPEKLNISGSDYKGVRTFGEQLKHIAASNYLIWSPITGEKPPDNVNDGKGPDNMKAKADIIKYVKDSFAFGHKSVATLTSANLVEPITSSSGRPTTRLFLATFAPAHCFDHYGQLVEYLRMNGIVPPASRGQ
jgi:uncharacterized damage-inducible protein DinB